MLRHESRHERQLAAVRTLIEQLALQLDGRVSVRLWEGTLVPLGRDVDPGLFLSISGPGVISSR